ncbi:glycosyltransferase family 39 protein [Candidatus Pacearchaeota archaeon]|nr:glycosyltransferase family 39 protein [Candidatus Pacearchaeota archaeon]
MSEKNKASQWLKDRHNLIMVLLTLFAAVIRIYYWVHTAGQPLWWDESEYGATAKHLVLNLPYTLNAQRPFLFPGIFGVSLLIGMSEQIIKFLWVVLPSILVIPAIYLLGKEMFNKNVALIAAALATVSWTLIFWAARLQPDSMSLLFQVLAILFMWRYWKNEKRSSIVWSAVFTSLGFQFKVSGLLVPVCFFIFLIMKERLEFLKKKDYWIFLLVFVALLIPQFIYSYYSFGSPFALFTQSGYAQAVVKDPSPFGWYNLKFFYSLNQNLVFFALFLIGLVISLQFLLYLDILAKDKKKFFDPSIFGVMTLIIVSAFYIFYIKGTEDRWVFLWLPFIFFMIGQALMYIYEMVKPQGRKIGLGIVIVLLLIGGYYQLASARDLIEQKKTSYMPVEQAGLWIKDHSNKNDVVITQSQPQISYYAERKIRQYYDNESDTFSSYLEQNKPRFLTASVFEHHPVWLQSWLQANQNKLKPVYVIYADQQQTQPVFVVYEVIYNSSI